MIVLLWKCGLRVNEAVNVRVEDIQQNRDGSMRVHVVVGKGEKQRFIGLGKKSARHIRKQIRNRKKGVLLDTRKGDKICTTQCRQVLERLGKAHAIKGRCHPHRLRHTFARDLHNEGFSVLEISTMLGHEDLGTTQTYLQDLGIIGEALTDKMLARD